MKARKRAKAGGGQLLWSGKSWSARYWAVVDGERVRRCVSLGTDNRAVAAAKLARLAQGEADASDAAEPETFEQAARRLVPESIKTWRDRMKRLETDAFPVMGGIQVSAVRPAHIRAALDAAVARGLSRTTCSHLLVDISTVLGELWRDEAIAENPAKRVRVPKTAKVDARPRVVLTDEELARFLACPDVSPELHLVALVSRTLGGMRTSDLHAWSWQQVDTLHWQWADVPRPKTGGVDRLALPGMLAAPLQSWWHAHGSPSTGPVFPARQGKRAGQAKRPNNSYAGALRDALWLAGVVRPLPGYEEALAAEQRATTPDERAALAAKRRGLCLIQAGSAEERPVDFHSFRRAYATGLARAGANVQQAMRLAGHRTAETHQRYVRLTEALATPDAALPRLKTSALPSFNRARLATPGFPSAPDRIRTYDLRLRRPGPPSPEPASIDALPLSAACGEAEEPQGAATCPSDLPNGRRWLDAQLADALISRALRCLADRGVLSCRQSSRTSRRVS